MLIVGYRKKAMPIENKTKKSQKIGINLYLFLTAFKPINTSVIDKPFMRVVSKISKSIRLFISVILPRKKVKLVSKTSAKKTISKEYLILILSA